MPEQPAFESLVDAPRERSLSFAPPGTTIAFRSSTERPSVAVGPGRPSDPVQLGRGGPLVDTVSGFPIQLAKVQRPVLRAETLERPRLLDWLHAKSHHRVILLIADAGFGKTTLLADFSRRTRVRTLWYRLDPDDRDWTSLLHHLVAAGREHEPGFASATASLLGEIGVGGPSRDAVMDTFLRELGAIAQGGAVIIFDDFHVVDDAPDARFVARELVGRAPERVSIVFASRRHPTIPLGRLRAVGEVAEVGTDDLRFDTRETAQLFTETYGRHLDDDILRDLAARTEGWVASLQLVQAALRNRTPTQIRQFVKGLSGADSDLYDYLAEEVVGDLPADVQRFLMTTSILQVVTPELAEVVSGASGPEVARLTSEAERLTLLSRVSGGPRDHQRYHPLVREFLEARLRSTDGAEAVADLHRRAGAAAIDDWRVAAHHFREAGDVRAMLAVINDAIPTIMGNAQYALAAAFMEGVPANERSASSLLIQSRVGLQQGDYETATAASQAVLDAADADPAQRDYAMLNLLAASFNFGYGENALAMAARLRDSTADDDLRAIAEATIAILTVQSERDLNALNRRLRAMALAQKGARAHHFGVTMYNLALNSLLQDRLEDANREVDDALEALSGTSSAIERHAALALKASIQLRRGAHLEAEGLVRTLMSEPTQPENETLMEASDAFEGLGRRDIAAELRSLVGDPSVQTIADRRVVSLARARHHLRHDEPGPAAKALADFPAGIPTVVGMTTARAVLSGQAALQNGGGDAISVLTAARDEAARTGMLGYRRVAEFLIASTTSDEELRAHVKSLGEVSPWHLSWLAEILAGRLDGLDEEAAAAIHRAASMHPHRWRAQLRLALSRADTATIRGARLLELIGDQEDVARLRSLARSRLFKSASDLGRALSRRLAERVYVEDQGRVAVRVGDREIPGSSIRRKVLSLLCYLLTRPQLTATRDQVLEALWPELDPDTAANSLNQTLYFLRRVFELNYSDDLSPGYVHNDSDVVWLDADLVTSRSVECRRMIRSLPERPDPEQVRRLSEVYIGRFALDFEYEEWASDYRDPLHASYLEIVERSVLSDLASGHHDRAIKVARQVLEVDPAADQLEVSLLRLYSATGAHAAAAEQYAHYASFVRDELGLDPPSLESLVG